jgi:hypothetical protein
MKQTSLKFVPRVLKCFFKRKKKTKCRSEGATKVELITFMLLILVENIGKSHINEICEDCLKICFCKILFVFKLIMFKNKGLYFAQDSVCF